MNTYKVTAKITEQKSLIYIVNAESERAAKIWTVMAAIHQYGSAKIAKVEQI
jgi:hypothetical protein